MKKGLHTARLALAWASLLCLGMAWFCWGASAPVHAADGYPVVVENCGHTLRFKAAPQRVVALYPPATELLLALELKKYIVGAAFTQAEPVLPELMEDYRSLKSLSAAFGVPREIMLSLRPDLVVDNQPDYFYNPANGFASQEELRAAGAQVYTVGMNCERRAPAGQCIEDTFIDLRNLGKIFGVSARAEHLIAQMQARLAKVRARVKGMPPVKVLLYDIGQGPLQVMGGKSTRFVVFKALGCRNAFPDLIYGPVSVEQVAVSDADYFVVLGYAFPGAASTQERVAYLKKTFANTPAVARGRIFTMPYNYMNPGIQNVEGLEFLARHIYPQAFK